MRPPRHQIRTSTTGNTYRRPVQVAFANPATDATGNMFVTYDPGRYDGVLVLIPNADGFEDIGWDKDMGGTHYMGKHAYYYAELIGPTAATCTRSASHTTIARRAAPKARSPQRICTGTVAITYLEVLNPSSQAIRSFSIA